MAGTFERPTWDEYFMLQAELAKMRSNCIVRKVGAVIVRDNRQLATGYNGTPPGIKNCYEGGCGRCMDRVEGRLKSGEDLARCLCNHAESNAMLHCAILGIEAGTKGATLYTTMAPCRECTKMAVTIGIKRFAFMGRYVEDDLGLAKAAHVKMVQIDSSRIAYWAKKMSDWGYMVEHGR